MPRMSEAEKQKSHKRILEAAGTLMRANGVDATSVSDVMQAAGLTHGGFYRHFSSKEDLVAAAFRHAVDEVVADLEGAFSKPEQAEAQRQYITQYLSLMHVNERGKGCPLAAIGSDISHHDGAAKTEASTAIDRMAHLLGTSEDDGTGQGFAIMAMLLGTVTLARLTETQEQATELLDAGSEGAQLLQQHWNGSSKT